LARLPPCRPPWESPETAERVCQELSILLDSEDGRFAELVVVTELLQSAERGDNVELVPALRQRAKEVWCRTTADGVEVLLREYD
jgi:hypothetical protein